MAVPAHDERDFAFARKFGLPIRRVVAAPGTAADAPMDDAYVAHAADEGWSTAAGSTGCRPTRAARPSSPGWPSRARRAQGHLPAARLAGQPPALLGHADPGHLLPDRRHRPRPATRTCRSACPRPSTTRAAATTRSTTTRPSCTSTCPRCGGPRRARDRHDGHVHRLVVVLVPLPVARTSADGPVDRELTDRWTPVDQYTGGAEHAVMHLLYAAVLHQGDARLRPRRRARAVPRLFNQGQILGADGERMSKSRGNVQDPDELVAPLRRRHGPAVPDVHGPVGPGRPVEPDRDRRRPSLPEPRLDGRRSTRTATSPAIPDAGRLPAGETEDDAAAAIRAAAHRTLRDVTADYEAFRFNTMIAKLMELTNTLFRYRGTAVGGRGGVGRGHPAAAADARAGRAAHQRGAVVATAGRGRDRRGRRSTTSAGPRSTRRRRPSRPARSRSRSTASCATRSSWPPTPTRRRSSAAAWPRPKIAALLDGRDAGPGHPRRRQARQHRPARRLMRTATVAAAVLALAAIVLGCGSPAPIPAPIQVDNRTDTAVGLYVNDGWAGHVRGGRDRVDLARRRTATRRTRSRSAPPPTPSC